MLYILPTKGKICHVFLYFLRIHRQSIQVLRPVFFRGVEGSNKVWTSKTSLSVSRQDFVEHGGRVISAGKVAKQREQQVRQLQKRARNETVTSESAK